MYRMAATGNDRMRWAFISWKSIAEAIAKDEKQQELEKFQSLHQNAQSLLSFQHNVISNVVQIASELNIMEEISKSLNDGAAATIAEIRNQPVRINSLLAYCMEDGGGIVGNDVIRQALMTHKQLVVERGSDAITYTPIMRCNKATHHDQSESHITDVVVEYDEADVHGTSDDEQVQAVKTVLESAYSTMAAHKYTLDHLSKQEAGGGTSMWPNASPEQHIARMLERRAAMSSGSAVGSTLDAISVHCGRALSSSSRAINAAVLIAESDLTSSGTTLSFARAPCVFHWKGGIVYENKGGVLSVPISVLQKLLTSAGEQSHCRSILTTPGVLDAQHLMYVSVTACRSNPDGVKIYLVIESSNPLTCRQFDALSTIAAITASELDVYKLKDENTLTVFALQRQSEEISKMEEKSEITKWLLEIHGITSQILSHHSKYSDCTAFSRDLFWSQHEHTTNSLNASFDSVGRAQTSAISVAQQLPRLTVEDISLHTTHLLQAICPDCIDASVVEISREILLGDTEVSAAAHESRHVDILEPLPSTATNSTSASSDQYCIIALRENCCLVLSCDDSAQIYWPMGQLSYSRTGQLGGSAYVLQITFTDMISLQTFMSGDDKKNYSTVLDSIWSPNFPTPHLTMLPVLKMDRKSHSVLSKKLEESSLGTNLVKFYDSNVNLFASAECKYLLYHFVPILILFHYTFNGRFSKQPL